LINYYEDGSKNIGMHADSEQSLIPGSYIASVSLGAERFFDIEPIFAGTTGKTKMELDAISEGNNDLAVNIARLGIKDISTRVSMPHGSMIVIA
jgi:hypothetical protein